MCFNKHFVFFLLITVLAILFTSCNTTRHLKENEYLVSLNTINGNLKGKIDKQEIEPFIRQNLTGKYSQFFLLIFGCIQK
jgi:hypothetical protein